VMTATLPFNLSTPTLLSALGNPDTHHIKPVSASWQAGVTPRRT
jgi:hypothetical protein